MRSNPPSHDLFESWLQSREQPAIGSTWLRRAMQPDHAPDALQPAIASESDPGNDPALFRSQGNPYLLPAAARWARVGWYRLNDAPDELTTLATEAARLYTDAAQEYTPR